MRRKTALQNGGLEVYSTVLMDPAAEIAAVSARKTPVGPTVSELMEEFYRASDIAPPTAHEIANLFPWTDEEAAVFERTINEAFEQVEETPDRL